MSSGVSSVRRREILDALRRGTVPQRGLDQLAVGLERFAPILDAELDAIAAGGAGFKAIRGDYGSGKTFAVRWLAERARSRGFATAEVQISEGETPLHHLETVYRRVVEGLSTSDTAGGALRNVVDAWFFALEEEALAAGPLGDAELLAATDALAEQRLATISRRAPAFTAVLRAYRAAVAGGDRSTADGLLAWLGGQPHVAASVKRSAGIKGDLDHDGALGFLAGLLAVFAEFERDIQGERVRAGLANARLNGKRLGRPPVVIHKSAEIRQLHLEGLSKSEIARRLRIGRTSVRRILR